MVFDMENVFVRSFVCVFVYMEIFKSYYFVDKIKRY